MLVITIPAVDYFDEITEEFITRDAITLELEHSLSSLSKWESKWEKPFLGNEEKTTEESLSYIMAMTLTPNIPEEVYYRIPNEQMEQINGLLDAKMTATWFKEQSGGVRNRETITAELLYYWMFSLTIPLECETWHLNRLVTLIKVFNEQNAPQKKLSKRDLAARNRQLNESRKAQLNTNG